MSTIKKIKQQQSQTVTVVQNQDMQKELQAFLQKVVSHPLIHARLVKHFIFL